MLVAILNKYDENKIKQKRTSDLKTPNYRRSGHRTVFKEKEVSLLLRLGLFL